MPHSADLIESMTETKDQLASNLRRAFSGIVAGNVKEEGMRAIEQHGPFVIDGEPEIMRALDRLLCDALIHALSVFVE